MIFAVILLIQIRTVSLFQCVGSWFEPLRRFRVSGKKWLLILAGLGIFYALNYDPFVQLTPKQKRLNLSIP